MARQNNTEAGAIYRNAPTRTRKLLAAPDLGRRKRRVRRRAVGRIDRRHAMSDILIQCPVLRTPVSTGLSTEMIKFSSLPDLPYTLRCPGCGKLHHWRPKDAWVRKTPGSRDGKDSH